MAEIVSLNRARKAAAKAEAKKASQANRVAFGRTKAEKLRTEEARARGGRLLDGHRLNDD